ncbi:hypothetical protein TVAG_273780 [Trichomonas vaginalis G3]|uniref:Coiled coil protein n=1 Tax=Trichomonas vaginalis (strain ATCC PRA-98 / G3) TaxID=412133 RepID=A2EI55_TRIV3|nr:coiled-coil domain-containing protein 162 family [Trichomonas vaginalis G3]EAY07694.1 hypothetical protein TVAG_273780 [Trichomonas vaginalis G3]KAI5518476.1 coiled-coil domain-containing protein 162 family [Trichomonas vaginalis G3]|eukprot:XP_001319917.1 hypothetical protein [Trichomonas vaginalis G3]
MSAQELHSTLASIKEDLEAAFSSFGAGEIIAYNGNTVELESPEYYLNLTKQFIEQYKTFSLIQPIAYYSDKITRKLEKSKEIFKIYVEYIQNSLKSYLDEILFQNKVILDRINNEIQYQKYKNLIPSLIEERSILCHDLENSITDISLNQPNHNYKSVLYAIKYDLIKQQRKIQTDFLKSIIHLLPVTRRNEIVTRITTLLRTDLSVNSACIPSPIKNAKDIEPEMARLSSLMNVNFDLSEYDGQKFIYECDIKFSECFTIPGITLSQNAAQYDRIEHNPIFHTNFDRINRTKVNHHLERYIQLLLGCKEYEANEFFSLMLSCHPLMSDYPRSHAICVLSLRFSRCRTMLNEIYEKCKKLFIETFNERFALIIKELSTATTYGMQNSLSNCDYDSVFERLLELTLEYLNAKCRLQTVIQRLHEFSGSETCLLTLQKIIDEEPDLTEGVHSTFIHNYKRQSEIIDLEANLMEILFALHMHSCSNVPLCSQAGLPAEVFQTSMAIADISNIFDDMFYASKEICVTMSIPSHLLVYAHLAVIQEIYSIVVSNPVSKLTPSLATLSTVLNAEGTALDIFSSSFVNSYDSIVEFVESYDDNEKFEISMKVFQIRRYLTKLISLVIKQIELTRVIDNQLNSSPRKTRLIDEISLKITKSKIDSDINELEDFVDKQRLFVNMMSEIARYNMFESDARYFGILFKADDVFLTDADTAENIVPLSDVKRVLFTEIPDSNYFREPVDPYQNMDKENTIEFIKRISILSEISILNLMERSICDYLTTTDPFIVEKSGGKKIIEKGIIDYRIIPMPCDVLCLEESYDDLVHLRNFVSSRLQMLFTSVFNGTIFRGNRKTMNSLMNKSASPDMTIFSFMTKICVENKEVSKISDVIFEIASYNQLSYAAGIVSLLDECIDLKNHVDEIPSFKSALKYIVKEKYTGMYNIPEKYIPWFLMNLCNKIEDDCRPLVSNSVTVIRGKADDSVSNLSYMEMPKLSTKYLKGYITAMFAKFSFFLLQNNYDYRKITPVKGAFEVSFKEYERSREDYSRTIESEATRRSQGDQLSFVTKLLEVIIERITPRVENQILSDIRMKYDELKSLAAEPFAQPLSTLKPDVYMKRPRANLRETPYIPSPEDAEKQESQEEKFAIGKFIRSVCECIDREPKDQNNVFTIDLNRLTTSLTRLSNPINEFFTISHNKFVKTWNSYNTNMSRILEQTNENEKLAMILSKIVSRRLDDEIKITTKENVSEKLNNLNSLRNTMKTLTSEWKKEDKEITKRTKDEYEILYTDILAELQTNRAKYQQKKEFQYKTIQNLIKGNSSLDLSSIKPSSVLLRSTFTHLFDTDGTPKEIPNLEKVTENSEDQNFKPQKPSGRRSNPRRMSTHACVDSDSKIEDMKNDVEKLKERMIKMRISRAFLAIAIKRKYDRLIKKAEEDRILESTVYWGSRRSADQTQLQMETELAEGYKELSNYSDIIDDLKQQHEALTKENIQLFHWKSMTMARQERCHQQMKELSSEGTGVALQPLIAKIAEKQDELDLLKAETDFIEEEAEQKIREPMREVDRLRKVTTLMKTQNTMLRTTLRSTNVGDSQLDVLIKENEDLKEENQRLREAIQSCGFQVEENISKPKSARVGVPQLSLSSGRKIVKPSQSIKSARQTGILRFK